MATYNSKFEGFWTDRAEAKDRLQSLLSDGQITVDESALLQRFIEDGLCIIPQAVEAELIDRLIEEIEAVSDYPDYFIARRERQSYTAPTEEVVNDKTFRLIDLHVNSATARAAEFSPGIHRILQLIFNEPAQAFQSLTFIYGSQQGIHQDGAYVAVSEPLKFAASWIALEDVQPGSGEKIYVPGSHRFEDYLFSGEHKSWVPERDGPDAGRVYIRSLWERIRAGELEVQKFLPKKGDALIWAADLVHGGAKISNDRTRRSLVTHYCPVSVAPNYRRFSGNYCPLQVAEQAFISSRHYDLSEGAEVNTSAAMFSQLRGPTFMGDRRPTDSGKAPAATSWLQALKRRVGQLVP